jgi:endoglucanase
MSRNLTNAILAGFLALCSAGVLAAPERVLTIVGQVDGNRWGSGYIVQQGLTVETVGGQIPIVNHRGKRCIHLRATQGAGGYFSVGIAKGGWGHYQIADFGPDGALVCDIAGSAGGPLRAGLFDSDADGDGPDGEEGGTVSLLDYVQPTAEWQHVAVPLGVFMDANPALDLDDMLKIVIDGNTPGGETDLYISDLGFRTTVPERVYPPVKVNQVGYPPAWDKVAKVTPSAALPTGAAFTVRDADSGQDVFEGLLKSVTDLDAASGDRVYDADFSGVRREGTYVVSVPGVGESVPFRIADDVYGRFAYDTTRFWLMQRCGMELTPEVAGPDAHPACHTFDKEIRAPLGGVRDVSGGWHDAGDMNRYASWMMPTLHMLMLLYQNYPDAFTDGQFSLPESGDGVPDLLDEVKCELVWMRKMLIREGEHRGQVYDRVHESAATQPPGVGFYDRRHGLTGPDDQAACALVSSMAQASIVYRGIPGQEQFADACLGDALMAWDYLTRVGSPPADSMFSAAVMLFEATGRPDAHAKVKELAPGVLGEWIGNVVYHNSAAGVMTYCLSKRRDVDTDLQRRLRVYYKGYADDVVARARAEGYSTTLAHGFVYHWGSNGIMARGAAHLLVVNRFAPDPAYVEMARDGLHWLMGRNPVDSSMVTGYGTPPLGPIYHSMFGPMGPGLPMPPGYLCGGPSHGDAPQLSDYEAKCWRPAYTTFELTECSLGYQAPLTYLVHALLAGER